MSAARAWAGSVTADGGIRAATSAVVLAVAAFAAIVSYSHIYDLARAHGQSGTAARLLPLSVDGLIVAASLVMLHEARKGRRAPALARVMIGLGVAATVGANVAYGAAYGTVGAMISAWPAVAFVGSAELLMAIIRGPRSASAVPEPDPLRIRAVDTFAEQLAAGAVPSIRAIRSALSIGQPRAQQIQVYLASIART